MERFAEKNLRQNRIIWQEHSLRDFSPRQSLKSTGILYVFQAFQTEAAFFHGEIRALPHNLASAFGERFYSKTKFGKRRNTVCISSFPNCGIGVKDPAKAADTIVRYCQKAIPHNLQPWPSSDLFNFAAQKV